MMAESSNKTPRETARKTAGAKDAKASLRLQYYRSAIATPEKHKKVIKGLGFTRLRQVVEREDTPSIRGMVGRVPHLVRIIEN
jgi:large subunit ribosomal protein L30